MGSDGTPPRQNTRNPQRPTPPPPQVLPDTLRAQGMGLAIILFWILHFVACETVQVRPFFAVYCCVYCCVYFCPGVLAAIFSPLAKTRSHAPDAVEPNNSTQQHADTGHASLDGCTLACSRVRALQLSHSWQRPAWSCCAEQQHARNAAQALMDALTPAKACWLFGAMSLLSLTFVACCVPETGARLKLATEIRTDKHEFNPNIKSTHQLQPLPNTIPQPHCAATRAASVAFLRTGDRHRISIQRRKPEHTELIAASRPNHKTTPKTIACPHHDAQPQNHSRCGLRRFLSRMRQES